ncbi:unnamed protein product [Bathycoccus prasinos]
MKSVASCPLIKSILVLDGEGKRIAVKYFDPELNSIQTQLSFERSIFQKTIRTNARSEQEIILFESDIVVYKFTSDLLFFVSSGEEENEIIVGTALQALFESISLLLRGIVEKRTALENLDLILLSIDEIVDGGVILETDPNIIASRVSMRGVEGEYSMDLFLCSQHFQVCIDMHLKEKVLQHESIDPVAQISEADMFSMSS